MQERGDHLFLGPGPEQIMNLDVLHEVEGLCLVMMCSCRVMTRKVAIHLLKEVRNIFASYSITQVGVHRRVGPESDKYKYCVGKVFMMMVVLMI